MSHLYLFLVDICIFVLYFPIELNHIGLRVCSYLSTSLLIKLPVDAYILCLVLALFLLLLFLLFLLSLHCPNPKAANILVINHILDPEISNPIDALIDAASTNA